MVIRHDVVAERDIIRPVLDVEEAVVPVHGPAPDQRVRRHGTGGGVLEGVPVEPGGGGGDEGDGVVARVPGRGVGFRGGEAVPRGGEAEVADYDVAARVEG